MTTDHSRHNSITAYAFPFPEAPLISTYVYYSLCRPECVSSTALGCHTMNLSTHCYLILKAQSSRHSQLQLFGKLHQFSHPLIIKLTS
jgi:hypothetical protein